MPTVTSVAIAEDEASYRDGLSTLLGHQPDLEVVGTWESGTDLLGAARALKGLWPAQRIVALTVFEEPATILEAICAGVDGYLLKTISAKELLARLRELVAGGAPLSGGVARTVLDLVRSNAVPLGARPGRLTLSEREQEVLRCLVRGQSYKQVAAELSISIDTVRSHIRKLYRKLQVHRAAEAVSRAIREGLV